MQITRNRIRVALVAVAALFATLPFLATSASASDGVIELNQTCAVETGCLPSDGAGYPIFLVDANGPRSFRLTSDLVIPDANTIGIYIDAGDVSIDLNGFSIIRSDCRNAVGSCAAPAGSTGIGILQPGTGRDIGLSVSNGSIVGMGAQGILAQNQADIRDVRVRWNRLEGISVADASSVVGCETLENGGTGIVAGVGSNVHGNTARDNGGDGLYVTFSGTVENNSVYSNDGDGIEAGSYGVVRANTSYGNGGEGILVGQSSTVVDNTASSNGGDGIHATSGINRIHGNVASFNSKYGLRLVAGDIYSGNRLGSNGIGGVLNGENLGSNWCTGAGVVLATCP